MQIAILQHNPHLGNHSANAKSLTTVAKFLGLGDDGLCLTSAFALSGNPWPSIAEVGGFFKRLQEAQKELEGSPVRFLLQTQSEDLPYWLIAQGKEQEKTSSSCLTFENISVFAPFGASAYTAQNIKTEEIPREAHLIYLSCADRFCDGFDPQVPLTELAKKTGLPLVYVNTCGAADSIVFGGQSMLISAEGEVLAKLEAFQEDVYVFEFDGKNINAPEHYLPSVNEDGKLFQAACLSIKDYAKKCGIKKAVIGMSGGMDSALIACLACEALGAENVLGIMMPSKYSSDHSVKDATSLMRNLGMQYESISISEITQSFENTLQGFFDSLEPLANPETDTTPENIQARTRGNLLMAIANRTGSMVIGTGNKSEAAMGYCTLYGDTVGALEPISDIYKTRVYALAKWYNDFRQEGVIPQNILTKAPSAELRPDQKDEDSLPPYPVLDAVLHMILEQGQDPNEVSHTDLSSEDKKVILSRLAISEFKRQQSPFVVRLTSCAFGSEWVPPICAKTF